MRMTKNYSFKKNIRDDTQIVLIEEIREAKSASEYDIKHLQECGDNEIRVVSFVFDSDAIALGKTQHSSYIKDEDVTVIKKITKGTAVYFDGTELGITVIIGPSVTDTLMITTTVQMFFISIFNDILKEHFGIDSAVTEDRSRHEYKPAGCFNALTKGEIQYDNDKKLAGCSFTRDGNKIAGHIMMYLTDSYKKLNPYLNDSDKSHINPISVSEIPNTEEFNKDLFLKAFINKIKE